MQQLQLRALLVDPVHVYPPFCPRARLQVQIDRGADHDEHLTLLIVEHAGAHTGKE